MKLRLATSLALGLALAAGSGVAIAQQLKPAAPPDVSEPESRITETHEPALPTPAAKDAPTLVPTPADGAAALSEGTLSPKLQPQSVTVVLINGSTLVGTISEADQWTMKTSFGTANLPLSAVAGVRMAQEGSATTTVVLHNGDTLTGALEFEQVVIQTEWGRAEILGTHVASILFTPGLKWSAEAGLNGNRWKLVTDVAARPAQAAPPNSTAVSTTAPPRPDAPNRPPGRR